MLSTNKKREVGQKNVRKTITYGKSQLTASDKSGRVQRSSPPANSRLVKPKGSTTKMEPVEEDKSDTESFDASNSPSPDKVGKPMPKNDTP